MGEKKITTLVPVCLGDEETFWLSSDGMDILKREIEELKNWSWVGRLCLVTDNSIVFERLKGHCPVMYIEESVGQNNIEFLPRGTSHAIDQLKKFGINGPLLIKEFRMPGIVEEHAGEIYKQWVKTPEKICVSVSEPFDHPAQMKQYISQSHISYIHLFEKRTCLETKKYVTRPCVQPVPGNDVTYASQRVWDGTRLGDSRPLSFASMQEVPENSIAAVFDTAGRCVFHVPPNKIDWIGEGKPVGGAFLPNDPPLVISEQDGGFYLRIKDAMEMDDWDVVILSWEDGEKSVDNVFYDSRQIYLPVIPECSGVFCIMGKFMNPNGENCGFELPFNGPNCSWKQTATGRMLNLETGLEIYGRQNMPQCYAVDGAISIGFPSVLLDIEKQIVQGKVRAGIAGKAKVKIIDRETLVLYRKIAGLSTSDFDNAYMVEC
ncbi:MAG: hypothetical protein HUN04_08515 [Desulfobacter sp.]|nr:MAG: hypothetical protein HUN04_08515 [Desulfobacter sp.]